MALIDKASLLMVPSTYEAGKLYNVLPSGNRAPDNKGGAGYDQTRADFTFDRGTDHGATRIGSDGLIKKYRENTLEHSNNFSDTSYTKVKTSLTSGQPDKDGGTNAWKYQCSSNGASYFYKTPATNSAIRTRSIYAKAGTASQITFLWDSFNQNEYATFDLSNGTFTNAGCLADMESVGDGWYRCSTTITDASNTYAFLIGLADKTGSASTAGDNVYIMYAQQETSLVATDYLDSGATTGKAGVLIDLPRINYDANGENGSLLLEPSRQQLLPYSEYFNNWTALLNITPYANAIVSPEGLLNATKLVEDSATAIHRIYQIVSITSGQSYTQSVFAKEGERRYLQIAFGSKISGTDYANFDLKEGEVSLEVGSVNATIEPYGNGWYRCSATSTANVTSSEAFYYTIVDSGSASRFASYTGNGTSGVYIFGAQVENLATYATSYIPNHSGTGGVTRAADSCSITGASDVIGQTEGTLFVEFDILTTGEDMAIMNLYNETTPANSIYFYLNSSNVLSAYVDNSGTQASPSSGVLTKGVYKAAIAYKANDFAFYINGSLVGSDVSGSVPTCGAIRMENYNAVPTYQEKTAIKQMALFQERLTNAELATLTTL